MKVEIPDDELDFILTYDPERERSATRRDMVGVLEHIQAVLSEAVSSDTPATMLAYDGAGK